MLYCLFVCFDCVLILFACSLKFHRTLKIAARTLSDVFVCLFVCLFVVIKPENLYFAPCVWREVTTPGNLFVCLFVCFGMVAHGVRRCGAEINQTRTTCVTLETSAQTKYLSING